MSVREYIGARYAPIIMGTWDNTREYEPLCIVEYQGDSYTSRQFVPVGVAITNDDYWALTGNYNAQVQQYRQEVLAMKALLPDTEFSAVNTVKDAIDGVASDVTTLSGSLEDLGELLPSESFSSESTVKDYIDARDTRFYTGSSLAGKTVVFLGDSIFKGDYATVTLPQRFANVTGATCVNYSNGGATASNAGDLTYTAYKAVNAIQVNPDYCYMMYGTNDYGYQTNIGQLDDWIVSEIDWTTMGGLAHAIERFMTLYPSATLVGIIPPYMPNDNVENSIGQTALNYKSAIETVYNYYGIPTINFTSCLSVNEWNWSTWVQSGDTLHPNEDCLHKMADYIARNFTGVGMGFGPEYKSRSIEWNDFTMDQGATAINSSHKPRYKRCEDGGLLIDFYDGFNITDATVSKIICRTPLGYRPNKTEYFPIIHYVGDATVCEMGYIDPQGYVSLFTVTGGGGNYYGFAKIPYEMMSTNQS